MNEFDLMKEKIMDAVKEGKTDIENHKYTANGDRYYDGRNY